jgi:MSHA biogenesis protein MshO
MIMKTEKTKSGFTLVEMMVTMLVGAVLALSVGAMLIFAYMAWADNSTAVRLHNDASLAMVLIGQEIRESNIEAIAIDGVRFTTNPNASGSRLDFDAVDGVRSNSASVVVSGDSLQASPQGIALVEGGLSAFSARFNSDASIDVSLTVTGGRGAGNTTLEATFTPRN